MFNRKQETNKSDLLRLELNAFDINIKDGQYHVKVGDCWLECKSLDECLSRLQDGNKELKNILLETWNHLEDIANLILHNEYKNEGSINNLLFLNSVEKSHALASRFTQLEETTKTIEKLLFIDIKIVSNELIHRFNIQYLKATLLHYLIMQNMYRISLVKRYAKTIKTAQVSGPWANLDLPMEERMWSYSDDEDYFESRQKARRQQARYNPEYTNGFYYVWQDFASRDPYRFEDIKNDEQPYKGRHILQIAALDV